MSDLRRVGLIGDGLMDHGTDKNILQHDYPLTIVEPRNRKPVESLLVNGTFARWPFPRWPSCQHASTGEQHRDQTPVQFFLPCYAD